MRTPGYWIYETGGVLRPAVEAYLNHEPMTPEQISAMRAYLRQWIMADVWHPMTEGLEALRQSIDGLVSRKAIDEWIDAAEAGGMDPL